MLLYIKNDGCVPNTGGKTHDQNVTEFNKWNQTHGNNHQMMKFGQAVMATMVFYEATGRRIYKDSSGNRFRSGETLSNGYLASFMWNSCWYMSSYKKSSSSSYAKVGACIMPKEWWH